MKLKVIALSIAMAASVFAANAQNDIFVGIGAGAASVFTPGLNTPTVYGNIQVGKYITPVWGVRGVIGGPFQTLNASDKTAYINNGAAHYSKSNKLFGEFNLDGIVNFSNIWAEDLAKLDFYLFAGPSLNVSSEGTAFAENTGSNYQYLMVTEDDCDKAKVRLGASVGLGLAYNFTNTFALGIEARGVITPSIFGDADAYRKAEGTGRLTLNGVWTIGGKRGKFARAAAAAAAAGYISKEAADALAAEAVAKNPKIVEKVVEKEVVKQVEKLVNNEIPSSTAVFFELGKATLTDKDKARLQLYAESIKNADATFTVAGYADKKTGTAKINQTLSEKRAQVVYDYLVSQGVPASKLEKTANGGVDPIFFNNDALSRTVIVKAK